MKYVETNAPREASKDDSRENDRLGALSAEQRARRQMPRTPQIQACRIRQSLILKSGSVQIRTESSCGLTPSSSTGRSGQSPQMEREFRSHGFRLITLVAMRLNRGMSRSLD
jgi:hypothetical protein